LNIDFRIEPGINERHSNFPFPLDEIRKAEGFNGPAMGRGPDYFRDQICYWSLYYYVESCRLRNSWRSPDPIRTTKGTKSNISKLCLRYFEELEKLADDYGSNQILAIQKFLTMVESDVIARKDTTYWHFGGGASVSVTGDGWEIISALVHQYRLAFSDSSWLKFGWAGISSGEQSMITLFSRFYDLVKAQGKALGKKVLVLIDEGTESFHPEWQRNFVKYLIDFVPGLFSEGSELQFVLTTNSPLLLSDFPKQNVVFVNHENQEDEIDQTFGANIHTLLAKGMFLKSTIGAFAEAKIKNLIAYLIEEPSTILDDKVAEAYIKLLAEPMIQKELQRKLDNKRFLQRLKRFEEQNGIKEDEDNA
jgi:hypothetical protein